MPEDDIGKAAEDLLGLLVVFAVCTTLPVFCSAQAVRKAEEKMANKSGKVCTPCITNVLDCLAVA